MFEHVYMRTTGTCSMHRAVSAVASSQGRSRAASEPVCQKESMSMREAESDGRRRDRCWPKNTPPSLSPRPPIITPENHEAV